MIESGNDYLFALLEESEKNDFSPDSSPPYGGWVMEEDTFPGSTLFIPRGLLNWIKMNLLFNCFNVDF